MPTSRALRAPIQQVHTMYPVYDHTLDDHCPHGRAEALEALGGAFLVRHCESGAMLAVVR